MADAASCVKVSHAMVDKPKVFALAPFSDQGETDDRPSPTPSISRISDSAAAAAAPAMMAPHETALAWSKVCNCSAPTSAAARTGPISLALAG